MLINSPADIFRLSEVISSLSPRYTHALKLLFDFFECVLFRQAGTLINTAVM
jgi:hypothetical protein